MTEGIDDLYASFARALPGELTGPAGSLAATLGLAPSPEVPWSEVFSHEITLGAPLLAAEAMPLLPEAVVRDATLAHLLAIIEAFGTDRVEDGQVPLTSALAHLLAHVRLARDAALERVTRAAAPGRRGASTPTYERAERETLAAIRAEQEVLRSGQAVAFERYLAISHGKQRVGLPASLALAAAAGWDERRAACLARLFDAVWVALQLHDDVIDWKDDLARGGAWAASLAAHAPAHPVAATPDADTAPASMMAIIHRSGVLARMLAASSRRFRAARRRAAYLGAHRLARWAGERETITRDLALHEAESPGFANRAHALSQWARTVLG